MGAHFLNEDIRRNDLRTDQYRADDIRKHCQNTILRYDKADQKGAV